MIRPLALVRLLRSKNGRRAAVSEQDTTVDLGTILGRDHSGGLRVSSGKTYNRVEGLPILFGPTYEKSVGPGQLSIAVLGIMRTAHNAHWDSENLGHHATVDLRFGRRRGLRNRCRVIRCRSKIEPLAAHRADGGLAACFPKERLLRFLWPPGGRVYASTFRGAVGDSRIQ